MKRWPTNKAYFWESAPFFRLLVPVIAAIICYDRMWLQGLSFGVAIGIDIAALLVYLAVLFITRLRTISNAFSFACINIILFLSSWSLCYLNDIRNNNEWFGHETKASAYLARITEAPIEKDKTWKISVAVLDAFKDGHIQQTTGQAFIYTYKDGKPVSLHKGDTILVPNKWQPIKNPGNPFEFDYAHYCARNNLYYQQFVAENQLSLYTAGKPNDLSIIEQAHNWSMQQLDHYIQDSATKGLIQAMLLGDEVNLDEHLLQAYSETGIVHIIAISGANVTIFFFVISFLLWWLKDKKHLWIKYAVALPLVWFYVLMAGAPPSAIRAAAMFTILAVGYTLQKNGNSLNTLFATAVILLLAQPMWLFSVGFQLSFVAVLSLVLFYNHVYKLYTPIHKISRALWSTIAASIAAEILVAPLVIYYFHLFPLLFIIANVIAYIFMGVVLILGMLIVAFSIIPAVATVIGVVTTFLVTWFDKIVYWLQELNPASFHFLQLSAPELILLYIVITGACVFILKKKKPALFISLSTACLLLLSFCRNEWIALHQERLVVYNIGKSSYVELIQGKYYSILHDDSIALDKKNYTLKPAHTNWQAWRPGKTNISKEIMSIGNQTVLFLNQPVNTTNHFPVDYLVVSCDEKEIDASRLQQIFSPKLTVLGNNYNRKQLERLTAMFHAQNMTVYTVANDGAFIIDAH